MGFWRDSRLNLSLVITACWFSGNAIAFIAEFFRLRNGLLYLHTYNLFGSSIWVSRGAAQAINFNIGIVLFPACRNLISFLRASFPPSMAHIFDGDIRAHKKIAYAIMFWSAVHCCAHYWNLMNNARAYDSTGTVESNLLYHGNLSAIPPGRDPEFDLSYSIFKFGAGVSGMLLVLIFFLTITSSADPIRRSYFEIFYYLHYLTFLIFPLLYWHGAGNVVKHQTNVDVHDPLECSRESELDNWGTPGGVCPSPTFHGSGSLTWKWFILSVVIYMFELLIRCFHFINPVDYVSHKKLPSDVLQLTFRKSTCSVRKNMHHIGQYVFIKLPDISLFEWHPFTLTSAPEDDFLQVYIRSTGDWTAKAYTLFNGDFTPRIIIDGPYGTPSQGLNEFDTIICAGTGIGITPFASFVRSAMIKRSEKRIYFIWITPNMDCFEWFDELLQSAEVKVPNLRVMIFLTLSNIDTLTVQEIMYSEHLPGQLEAGPQKGRPLRRNFGRPNWDIIFDQVTRENPNSKVGVFACGPKPFTRDLREISKTKSKPDATEYNFFKENF